MLINLERAFIFNLSKISVKALLDAGKLLQTDRTWNKNTKNSHAAKPKWWALRITLGKENSFISY